MDGAKNPKIHTRHSAPKKKKIAHPSILPSLGAEITTNLSRTLWKWHDKVNLVFSGFGEGLSQSQSLAPVLPESVMHFGDL